MGFTPNQGTGTIITDLEQAKIAIDAAAFIENLLEPKLDSHQMRELRSMLSDLRMNFVNQQKATESA
jgi:hypothetical protein